MMIKLWVGIVLILLLSVSCANEHYPEVKVEIVFTSGDTLKIAQLKDIDEPNWRGWTHGSYYTFKGHDSTENTNFTIELPEDSIVSYKIILE